MQESPEAVAHALLISYQAWVTRSKSWAKMYAAVSDEAKLIPRDAFIEMPFVKPAGYDQWWAVYHPKYIKKVKQRDLTVIHNTMYHFLTAFARGAIDKEEPKYAIPPRGKKA